MNVAFQNASIWIWIFNLQPLPKAVSGKTQTSLYSPSSPVKGDSTHTVI